MIAYQRGDIVLCADGKGDYTSKPRPVLIVQNTDYIAGMESVTVCPITSILSTASVRVRLKANDITGLKQVSEVETDKITTIRAIRLSDKIGQIAEKELNKINYALRIWLDS